MFISIPLLIFGILFILLVGAASMVWVCRHVITLNKKTFETYKARLRAKKDDLIILNEELKIKTRAIEDFVYATNHYWENPLLKRLRGLINTLSRLRISIKQNLQLIKKPTDYGYGKIALKDWDEIDETLEKIVDIALQMEKGILERVTKVDDLQN